MVRNTGSANTDKAGGSLPYLFLADLGIGLCEEAVDCRRAFSRAECDSLEPWISAWVLHAARLEHARNGTAVLPSPGFLRLCARYWDSPLPLPHAKPPRCFPWDRVSRVLSLYPAARVKPREGNLRSILYPVYEFRMRLYRQVAFWEERGWPEGLPAVFRRSLIDGKADAEQWTVHVLASLGNRLAAVGQADKFLQCVQVLLTVLRIPGSVGLVPVLQGSVAPCYAAWRAALGDDVSVLEMGLRRAF